MRRFKLLVLDVATPLPANQRFRERDEGIFTPGLSKDILGWLGPNHGTKSWASPQGEVKRVVKVRHKKGERLVAQLCGQKADPFVPRTFSTLICSVVPEPGFRSRLFTANPGEAMATEMVEVFAEYGLAFMQAHKDLMTICRALDPDSRAAFEDSAMYRRPVARLPAGEARRAAEELDKSLAALGDREDLAAREFRHVAAALRSRLPAP